MKFIPIVTHVFCLAILSATVQGQETLDDAQLVAGARVRSAFRDVVAEARGWTVRVLVEGEPAAMGVVVREDGWVLTKASRVEGTLACRLLDGRVLKAEPEHVWPEHDLALLKVEGSGLTAVQWSDRGDPGVGEWLATSGQRSSPLGVGIVSVGRRSIPLVKLTGVLGVRLDDADGPATIAEVFEGSAAERAELQVGDVVFRINDEETPDRETMVRTIRGHEPGETVRLRVKRGEDELQFEAMLSHPFGQFLSRIAEQNQMGGELSKRRSGFPAVIQHDTVLSPDDCGGTVVDLDGRAVGINIARAGRTESYAIPAAVILPLLETYYSRGPEAAAGAPVPPAPPAAVRRAS